MDRINQDLQQEIDHTQQQTLDASRNIKRIALETEDIAGKTLNNLHEQGDNINKIEKTLDSVDNKIDQAEDGMDQLDKCCGLFICPWKRVRRTKKYGKAFSTAENQGYVADQPVQHHDIKLKRIVEGDDREDEIEENVNVAARAVGNLAMMANDMNFELTKQNNQLERVNQKAASNEQRLEGVVGRANRRLGQ